MDNVLIFSKSDNVIDSMLTVLKEQDYVFIIDDNVDEYLRIQISHNKDRSIQFTQLFLINRIVQVIPGMQEANMSYTLISLTSILTKDSKGKD